MLNIKLVAVILYIYIICFIEICGELIVETEYGKVSGTVLKSKTGRSIYSFMGIPYAEPPVGDLRFKPPVPKQPWQHILDCTELGNVCPQVNFYEKADGMQGSEDCLYLNIYTPQLKSTELLPVMIFIHGGGLSVGSAGLDLYGPRILLDKNIVLATFNYRLGALGFLSTMDEILPGNMGLKDQNVAISWIKRNIKYFGGNPERIVLFGQSVGGTSVHLHMLSPLSKDLFHGAIVQSGTALDLWALDTNLQNINNGKKLAAMLNCPTAPSQEMVDCLRNVEAAEIVKKTNQLSVWDVEPSMKFKPIVEPDVEGAFITKHPIDIIREGNAINIPLVVGVTTEDGAARTAGFFDNPDRIKEINEDFNRIAPLLFDYPQNDVASDKIRKYYFQDKDINEATLLNFINMYSDGRYFSGTYETVRLHTKKTNSPVYYYLFGYKGTRSYSAAYGKRYKNYGVCHRDELLYLFSQENSEEDEEIDIFDKYFAELMPTLWTNFAKTLDPTFDAPNEIIPTQWHAATSENMDCYYLGSGIHMAKNSRVERAEFWQSLKLHPSNSI